MVTIEGRYAGELRCLSVHGPSQAELVTDAPVDNQGRGSAFSPTDLVATALGTCIVTTMAIWAQRHEVNFEGVTFTATKEMTKTGPRRIERVGVTIRIPGAFTEDQRQRLEAVAHACPVHQSLHESVTLDIRFEWQGAVVAQ